MAFTRVFHLCNALCGHVLASVWLSPPASQSWDAVTCAASLEQWGWKRWGEPVWAPSADCWCCPLSPAKCQSYVTCHLRTALQGVGCTGKEILWFGVQGDGYGAPCLCYGCHHRESHLGNDQIRLWEREFTCLSANIWDVIDVLA